MARIADIRAEIDSGKTAVWSTDRVTTTIVRDGAGYRWTLYHLMLPREPRTVPTPSDPPWDWEALLAGIEGVQTSSDTWQVEASFTPPERVVAAR